MDSSRRQKQAMMQHLEQNNFSKLRHISSKWIQMGHQQISNPQAYGCHQEKKITSMQDNGHWYEDEEGPKSVLIKIKGQYFDKI